MFDMTRWTRGPIRHCKQIGQHEAHKAVRARTEARLAALKQSGVLTEKALPAQPQPAIIAARIASYDELDEGSKRDLDAHLQIERTVICRKRPTLFQKLGATLSAASLTLKEIESK